MDFNSSTGPRTGAAHRSRKPPHSLASATSRGTCGKSSTTPTGRPINTRMDNHTLSQILRPDSRPTTHTKLINKCQVGKRRT
jgi:hypothetical protein